jgi:hypothetical protein
MASGGQFDVSPDTAAAKVMLGGGLVLATRILIGNAG